MARTATNFCQRRTRRPGHRVEPARRPALVPVSAAETLASPPHPPIVPAVSEPTIDSPMSAILDAFPQPVVTFNGVWNTTITYPGTEGGTFTRSNSPIAPGSEPRF